MSNYIVENGEVLIQKKTSVFVEHDPTVFIQRDPTVFIKGDPGPPGPAGPPGEPSPSYLHTQSTASNTWLINHNLNAYPQIQLFSLGWVKIYADEQHLSLNTTQVSFSYPAVGYAILSL